MKTFILPKQFWLTIPIFLLVLLFLTIPILLKSQCINYFHEDMAEIYPEGIVYLNFHFIQNSSGSGNFGPNGDNNSLSNDLNLTGIFIANDILAKLNEYVANVVAPNIQYNNEDVPSVKKLPWRFELYTDSENESDLYGGIWFWESPNYETDLAQTHEGDILTAYITSNFQPYEDNVLDVYLVEYNGTDASQTGATGEGINVGSGIYLFNIHL